jgi:hypothetical protein
MIFHFSIYHSGSLEAAESDCSGTERARAEAFRLLEHSTGRIVDDIARTGQTRVVVSDGQGKDLFTLTYVAAETAEPPAAS